jgi:hypothetical protein
MEPGKGADRQFVIESPGFEPFVVRPGALGSDLTIQAPLVPVGTTDTGSSSEGRPVAGPKGVRPTGTATKTKSAATTATGDSLDIRTNR